jgi:hypothetical protein
MSVSRDPSCTPQSGLIDSGWNRRRRVLGFVVIFVVVALGYPPAMLAFGFPAPAVLALAALVLPPVLAMLRRAGRPLLRPAAAPGRVS